MIFTWRHIKRWLFENDFIIESILRRRKKRLEFYENRRKIKELCKQKSLDEKYYESIYWLELNGVDYNVLDNLHSLLGYIEPSEDLLLYKHKLVCLDKTFGRVIFDNYYIYYNEFYELWCVWRDAPFWKDYEVWKKLHLMKDDFN